MDDLQLIGFLVWVASTHLQALLIPVCLMATAFASAAPLDFEPVAI